MTTHGSSRGAAGPRPALLVLTVAALLAALVPEAARADVTAPYDLARERRFEWDLTNHAVAVDREGDLVAAWDRTARSKPAAWGSVELRRRPAGGSWGGTRTVSPSRHNASLMGLEVDDDGHWVVLWAAPDGEGNAVLYGRRVGRGGALGTVRRLSRTGQRVSDVDLAVGPTGTAWITWKVPRYDAHGNAVGDRLLLRRWTRAGDPAEVLGEDVGAGRAAVDVDRAGDVVLAWTSNADLHVARLGSDGTVRDRGVVASAPPPHMIDSLRLAVGGDGTALVAWEPGGLFQDIQLTRLAPGAVTGTTAAVADGSDDWGYDVGAGPAGAGIVMVVRYGETPGTLTRRISADGTMGDPRRWTSAPSASGELAVGPDGSTVVTWAQKGAAGTTTGRVLRLAPDGSRVEGPVRVPLFSLQQVAARRGARGAIVYGDESTVVDRIRVLRIT